MATQVQNRKCKSCQTRYKTKIRKGKDTRVCPECQTYNGKDLTEDS